MEPRPEPDVRKSRDERGATAVEYGLMVLLVFLAIVGTVSLIAPVLNNIFAIVTAAL